MRSKLLIEKSDLIHEIFIGFSKKEKCKTEIGTDLLEKVPRVSLIKGFFCDIKF